jgi:hypothetical protein
MLTNDTRNPRLFSWIDTLKNSGNDKRLSGLENGWPKQFKEEILPNLAIEPLAPFFCSNNGRPTKDLRTMVGLLVIQDMFNMPDFDTLQRLQFDISFRYALDIQLGNDKTLYVCPKTYYNFRNLIIKNELASVIFSESTRNLIDKFKVDFRLQRIDSMHFNTNMKRLSRLGVMRATTEKFLVKLRKNYSQAFETIEPSLIDRYLHNDSQGLDYFGQVRPSDRDKAMLTVAGDVFSLINLFKSEPSIAAIPEFALLNRVFQDQCRVSHEEKIMAGSEVILRSDDEVESSITLSPDELDSEEEPTNGAGISVIIEEAKVEMIPAKEISSGSLQNPSDPEAAYSGHKGQGYHVQLVETYDPTEADSNERPLNFITLVKVEPANEPDSAALIPAVDELENRGLKPEVIMGDTAYGGDANSTYAASKGVELLAPVSNNGADRPKAIGRVKLTSAEQAIDQAQSESFADEINAWPEVFEDESEETERRRIRLADFDSDKKGCVKRCPIGQEAKTKRNNNNTGGRAYFDHKVCEMCPHRGLCPVTITKNKAWLAYRDEQVRLDKRRAYQETDEFKDRYRWRSGIEGTNSRLARMGGKRLRVRGLKPATYKMNFKALALNAKRVIGYLSQKSKKIEVNYV